jgi:hypothetical protein
MHSTAPLDPPEQPTRVRVGGPDCTQPYWYPEGKVVVQVDIRGEHIGRRTAVEHGVVGDAGLATAATPGDAWGFAVANLSETLESR